MYFKIHLFCNAFFICHSVNNLVLIWLISLMPCSCKTDSEMYLQISHNLHYFLCVLYTYVWNEYLIVPFCIGKEEIDFNETGCEWIQLIHVMVNWWNLWRSYYFLKDCSMKLISLVLSFFGYSQLSLEILFYVFTIQKSLKSFIFHKNQSFAKILVKP
jgi:hypothetical protein